jgi:ABC-type nitrate/sulfonate/bicarbonate transport system substrate-binding protein
MVTTARKSASASVSRTAMLFSIAILLLGSAAATVFAAAAEPARLRISIPGLGSSSYPLIMAQKKGYFRAVGYEVELIPMAAGLAVKTLLAGEVAVTAAGTVLANLQGAKVRLIMGFIRELPYDLV